MVADCRCRGIRWQPRGGLVAWAPSSVALGAAVLPVAEGSGISLQNVVPITNEASPQTVESASR